MESVSIKSICVFLFILCVFSSCMRQFAEVAEAEIPSEHESLPWTRTKSAVNNSNQGDYYSIMRRQQNPERRVISFIHYRHGEYSFDLTPEEANVLGISEELFVKYTSLVDSLNVEINTKEK